MEKLSLKDREELQKVKKDLLEILDNYLDSCVFLQDTRQLRRFTRSLHSFLRFESERIRRKELDVQVLDSRVEIREDDEVHVVEIERDSDGTVWGVYPNRKDEVTDTMIYPDSIRNVLILFKKGILKLEDFPREKLK